MILPLFRTLSQRLHMLFAARSAAQPAQDAERRTELLRYAQRYDDEGLHGIAQHLRRQAERLVSRQSLESGPSTSAPIQADD